MLLPKRDIYFAVGTGLVTGAVAWKIFNTLDIIHISRFPNAWLIALVPIIWIAGLILGRLLHRFISASIEFSKFVAIGFTNAAIDFGYLNIMIVFSGVSKGYWFAIFKTSAFIVANIHSYFMNKYWTFESRSKDPKEFVTFFSITLISLLINVSTATYITTWIQPQFGLNLHQWANVAAVVGAVLSLIVNFLGYKLVVFKK